MSALYFCPHFCFSHRFSPASQLLGLKFSELSLLLSYFTLHIQSTGKILLPYLQICSLFPTAHYFHYHHLGLSPCCPLPEPPKEVLYLLSSLFCPYSYSHHTVLRTLLLKLRSCFSSAQILPESSHLTQTKIQRSYHNR